MDKSLEDALLSRPTLGHMQEGMIEAVYSRWLKPNDTAIDGGACVGRHTLPLARAVGENGRVVAFEAVPNFTDSLREELRKAGLLNRVQIVQKALGSRPGHTTFNWVKGKGAGGFSGLRSTKHQTSGDAVESIEVDVTTIDQEVQATPVTFIKLDLEGGEFDAIYGAKDICRRDGPVIAFEFGFSDAAKDYGFDAATFFQLFSTIRYGLWDMLGKPVDLSYWQGPRMWNVFAAPLDRGPELIAVIGKAAAEVASALSAPP